VGTGLGIGGGIGALIGIALVAIIEPANAGGIGLLLFISVVFFTTLGLVGGRLLGKPGRDKSNKNESENNNPKA
jgi:hypothetical protein